MDDNDTPDKEKNETKALLIRPDNTSKRVIIDDYKDINKYLECRIFCMVANLSNLSYDMFGDDEALLVNEPIFNTFGSLYYGFGELHSNPIAGNVLAVGKPDAEGETTDLTDEEAESIEKLLKNM